MVFLSWESCEAGGFFRKKGGFRQKLARPATILARLAKKAAGLANISATLGNNDRKPSEKRKSEALFSYLRTENNTNNPKK